MAATLLTPTHIAIVLVVVLLLFGANRLPDSGRALGRGIREFREGLTGRHRDDDDGDAAQKDAKRPPEIAP